MFLDFIRDRARYYNCPVCGQNLTDCDLRLLRQVENRYTIQVGCAACKAEFVVLLVIQGDSVAGGEEEYAGLVPLQAEEAAEGQPARDPIQADEVLDLHLWLKDWNGSLTELAQARSERS
ncbi:MAG: hypothetical protein M3072_05965 [Candidatus Dormibacteraeota bacterium]|nr:hypothetical protein [Candidatus Dormibacteraeota bacterium]